MNQDYYPIKIRATVHDGTVEQTVGQLFRSADGRWKVYLPAETYDVGELPALRDALAEATDRAIELSRPWPEKVEAEAAFVLERISLRAANMARDALDEVRASAVRARRRARMALGGEVVRFAIAREGV